MEFERLLELVGDEPLFESALLLAGEANPDNVRLQLTRWKNAGRIYQLRRGLYTIAPPYQKVKPHPFVVANHVVKASYVSCQSALAFYEMIPENVPRIISVTGNRPGSWDTPLGTYHFRHIKPALLRGYRMTELNSNQQALVATPEKALLDLAYLQPGGDSRAYLEGLRLQNPDQLDPVQLRSLATLYGTPKMSRALVVILSMVLAEQEYEAV